ncbi:VanZ family protein [Brevibacillus laterosporus]|uniref:VanZ family protein n=1 Tax=Brevibacillus laterosporus TaxID=1465 RepID=A0AAP8QB11_BRELA|nr:VanZ family protein [Brevibacillus laterosporus]
MEKTRIYCRLEEEDDRLWSTTIYQGISEYKAIQHYKRLHHELPELFCNNHFLNLFGNILVFMPLGFFLPMLFARFASVNRVFLFAFITSLLFEIGQYLYMLGSFDVDDILLNSVGALCGFGCYRLSLFLIDRYRNRLSDDK